MSRYLDPKADVVFKRIFGEHPSLLKSFLNALLPLKPDQEIVELSYLPAEQVPHIPLLKRTIADVKCKDVKGRIFIVEMQIDWTDCFKQRLLFESGQAMVKQLEKGEEYKLLQPVYGLGIIAGTFDKESKHWYHHYQLVNLEKPVREVIEHLQLIFIELPKFPVHSAEQKKLRVLWLRFLREINEKTRVVDQELLNVPEISEAVNLAEEANYSPGQLQVYEDYWDEVSRYKGLINSISRRYDEGMAKGKAEGIRKGEAEMLLQIIRLKFRTVPKVLETSIMQLDSEQLLALSAQILAAKSIEEINSHLSLLRRGMLVAEELG